MRLIFVTLSALLAFSMAAGPRTRRNSLGFTARADDLTPVLSKSFPRIFGGFVAGEDIQKRVARLLMCRDDLCGSCSAPVLSRKWLLTAAHCVDFDGQPATSIRVTLSGADYDVTEIRVHRDYVQGSVFAHDIAMIKVEGPKLAGVGKDIKFKPSKRDSHVPAAGREVDVAGYGQTGPGTGATTVLMQGDTTMLSPTACGSFPSRGFLCTATGRASGVLCPGDSGGPLFYGLNSGYRLAGINSAVLVSSSNFECGDSNTVHIYADVNNYYDDILSCLKGTCTGLWLKSDVANGDRTWVDPTAEA